MTSLVDSSGHTYTVRTRSALHNTRLASPLQPQSNIPPSTVSSDAVDIKDIRKLFNRIYKQWSASKPIDNDELVSITSQDITVDDFVKLTQHRECQRYISLIDNK